jgi:hypothetical protein
MYAFILALHNIIRWIVLILGLLATGRAISGWSGKKQWSDIDRKIGLFFTSSVDSQLLLGILLYFVFSNWGLNAILNNGMTFVMSQGEYRFFAIEHVSFMLLGLIFAHLGSALPKRIEEPSKKFKRTAVWYGLAIIPILMGIPWSRPLFP